MKKVLSLVLVIAMVISSMSFAFAGTFEDVTDATTLKAVEALTALGVVNGYADGTFKPENSITRAEMAAMLVRALGHSDLAAGSSSSFKDAKGKWYDGEVAIAQSIGLTDGYPDGTFKGDNKVSYTEAITMVMRALGYNNRAVNSNRAEAYNATAYKTTAARLGVLKNVVVGSGEANRGDVALMLYNSLEVQVVVPNEDGNPVGQWLVAPAQGATGTVRTLLDDVAKRQIVVIGTADLFGAHPIDVSEYLGEEVIVYTNDDDEILFVKSSEDRNNNRVTDAAADYDNATVNGDQVTLKYTSTKSRVFDVTNGNLIVNSVVRTNLTAQDIADIVNSRVHTAKFVASSGGTDKNTLVLEDINNTFLANSTHIAGKTKFQGLALPTKDGKVDETKLVFVGDASSLEDIQVNDVIQACVASNNIKFYVTRNTVEGTVTEKTTNNVYYYIDDVRYGTNMNSGIRGDIALKAKGVFFLDKDGEIAYADVSTVSNAKYAVIIGAVEDGKIESRFGFSVTQYPQVKMVNEKGETKIYDINTWIKSDGTLGIANGFSNHAGATTPVTAGDIEIDINTNAATPLAQQPVERVVKYTTNDDGKITSISSVTLSTLVTNGTKKEARFLADENTLVLGRDNNGKYSLVELDKLTEGQIDYQTIVNGSSFGWDLVVITDGLSAQSSIHSYAVVVGKTDVLDANNNEVSKITVLINGEKVTYVTDKKATAWASDQAVRSLVFNTNGTVNYDATNARPTDPVTGVVTATAVSANGLRLNVNNGAAFYTLSADVVVIKQNATANAAATLADLNDIRITNGTSKVILFDKDGDEVIDLIYITR